MKFTGFEVFDDTIQRTNSWLKDLMQELNWSDRRKTYVVFRCVLHGLRDHLSVKDAAFVGDQLPMLIRGAYFEHWDPSGKPLPLRTREEFFSCVAGSLARDGENAPAQKWLRVLYFAYSTAKPPTEKLLIFRQSFLPPSLIYGLPLCALRKMIG